MDNKLDEAIDTLEIAVTLLEEAADARLRDNPAVRRPAAGASGEPATLFSPAELTNVKQRLDEAIEQLESALEVADGPR